MQFLHIMSSEPDSVCLKYVFILTQQTCHFVFVLEGQMTYDIHRAITSILEMRNVNSIYWCVATIQITCDDELNAMDVTSSEDKYFWMSTSFLFAHRFWAIIYPPGEGARNSQGTLCKQLRRIWHPKIFCFILNLCSFYISCHRNPIVFV